MGLTVLLLLLKVTTQQSKQKGNEFASPCYQMLEQKISSICKMGPAGNKR